MRTGRLAAAAAAITFAATFAALALSSDSAPAPAPREPAPTVRARGGTPTDARIGRARAAVRAAPEDADGYTRLAAAYLQKVRETGDAGYYTRAGEAVDRALALAPGDPAALTERGTLALARHDFRGALRDGLRARRATPDLVRPYGVVADASIELGRYDEAERTLQRMIDLKPDLGSYARVSYFRELHGDLPGAVEAMRLAVSASGGAGENAAHVQTLLGGLELTRGRRAAAARSYRAALQSFRDYAPARAGLARLRPPRDAAHALRGVVARLPLPEHAIALGEAELAAGRPEAARREFDLVRAQQRLLRAAGVDVDVELAVFEADHGDAARAVTLARTAWRRAPSVRSADALGWALTRAGRPRTGASWARRALRLGSRDPGFLYHAGLAERGAGRTTRAGRLLCDALASPALGPLRAGLARRALRAL